MKFDGLVGYAFNFSRPENLTLTEPVLPVPAPTPLTVGAGAGRPGQPVRGLMVHRRTVLKSC
jgi:hypothetical protein